MTERSFIKLVASSIRANWNLPAFSNYQGATYTYAQLGERIVRIRLLLQAAGVGERDKVALVGRNSAGWAMSLLSILCNGRVAVPILQDFKPSSIHHIINHSGATALFVSGSIWENLDISQIERVKIVVLVDDLSILYAHDERLTASANVGDRLFAKRYPSELSYKDIKFYQENPEDLAMLSYTSGTSGFSKGVMLPYRALWGNVRFALDRIPDLRPGQDVVSILPMAHMYGLLFELCTEVSVGMHVHFLTRTPSPRIIAETFAKYSPYIIVAVPLIMEKIVRKQIFPMLEKPRIKMLLKLPIVRERIHKTIRQKLSKALGGNFFSVIIGGAAFSRDVEHFLHTIRFPYTVGYGMTECAPLITYAPWDELKEGSVGRVIQNMEIRIDSPDPRNIVGEIQVRGVNVMLGYYNNEQATRQTFTDDGWLRTGDLGTIDKDGFLFIKGRCKSMILGPSGQNIYPEEIEDQVNGCPYVAESIVVEREDKLVALIHPDIEAMDKAELSMSDISQMMQQNITRLNQELPAYCRLSSFQLYPEEFEKTPKRSIKRYLYK